MKKLLLSFILINSFSSIFSQKQTVAYSREYNFKEGVFLTIDNFITNSPIEKSSIVSAIPKNDLDYFHQITTFKYITIKDTSGVEQKVETASVWGYCQNRSIYLNYNNSFNRINVIGTLCHFTAVITNFVNYTDPMYGAGINNTYDELRQFVLDTQINMVVAFNVTNMEIILANDELLHAEFMKIKKRKRGDAIFVYLRKYNEKHPLYLNAN